jgi:hypothetical protein
LEHTANYISPEKLKSNLGGILSGSPVFTMTNMKYQDRRDNPVTYHTVDWEILQAPKRVVIAILRTIGTP